MGALSELNLASNDLGAGVLPEAWTTKQATLSVNVLKNHIGVEQAGALVVILKEHPTLKSLCGNKGDQTELDMSSKMWGAEDAIMLAAEIVDNGALTKLDVRQNDIHGAKAGKAFAEMLAQNTIYTLKELDLSSQAWNTHNSLDAAFAKEFAVGLSDNGALSKLDVSTNGIPPEEKALLQGACDAKGVSLAL
jgi:hypothetical protein